jgi:hypothetical protein
MVTTLISSLILTPTHVFGEWLPDVITALRLAAASIGFAVAVHRAIHHWHGRRER